MYTQPPLYRQDREPADSDCITGLDCTIGDDTSLVQYFQHLRPKHGYYSKDGVASVENSPIP